MTRVLLGVLTFWTCLACKTTTPTAPRTELKKESASEWNEASLAQAFAPRQDAPSPNVRTQVLHTSGTKSKEDALQKDFENAWTQFERHLKANALEEAQKALEVCQALTPKLTPASEQKSHSAAFRLGMALHDGPMALGAVEDWLVACGPEQIDRCRGEAQSALAKIAASSWPEKEPASVRLKELRQADTCLKHSENRGSTLPRLPCLASAFGLYKKADDRLMVARIRFVEAKQLLAQDKKQPEGIRLLRQLSSECTLKVCYKIREQAFRLTFDVHLKRKEYELSAQALAHLVQLRSEALPESQQRYAWTEDTLKRCKKLDDAQGNGFCHRVTASTLPQLYFYDFSQKSDGPQLVSRRTKEIAKHFGVLIEQCLRQQSQRLQPRQSETYQLRWMVVPEGKVMSFEINDKPPNDSPLANCLREQFALWRYPPFEGENQHMTQSFTVTPLEFTDAVRR